MSELKVKLKALAYERSKLPTKISDLIDDKGLIKAEDLVLALEDLKQWVICNFEPKGSPISDLNGGTANTVDWGNYIFGGEASTTDWRINYYGSTMPS